MSISVQKIVDRISDAFSIFDFSFFISGITSCTIICYGLSVQKQLHPFESQPLNIIILIIAAYLCGLVSFAIGKYLRLSILNGLKKLKKVEVSRFVVRFRTVTQFMDKWETENSRKLWKDGYSEQECKLYYTAMWSFLRDQPEAKETLNFINRYWIMQAAYEGLLTSALLAIIVGIEIEVMTNNNWEYFLLCLILPSLIIFLFCFREGTRYAEAQIDEVVIAYKKFKY